jgi:hypothetical protein
MKARKIRKYLKQGVVMKACVQEEGIDFTQNFLSCQSKCHQ